MYEELMQQWTGRTQQAFAPARNFAGLTVDHMEKLANFQLEATRAYFDLGVEQMRGALAVNDTKSFRDYVGRQRNVATAVGRKLTDDAETLAAFGRDYAEETGKLAQANVTNLRSAATPKAKKSA